MSDRDTRLNNFLIGDLRDAEKALQMAADSEKLLPEVAECIEQALECVSRAKKMQENDSRT